VLLNAQRTLIVSKKEGALMHITTWGIDLAKHVFQLHGGGCARPRGAEPTREAQSVDGRGGESAALCDRDGSVRKGASLGAGV